MCRAEQDAEVPGQAELVTSLTDASQKPFLVLPGTAAATAHPWWYPAHLSCPSSAARQKRLKFLQFLSESVSRALQPGEFTWKGHESVSFLKTSSAIWGQDKVFLLFLVLGEFLCCPLLFRIRHIFSWKISHQKTAV